MLLASSWDATQRERQKRGFNMRVIDVADNCGVKWQPM